MFYFPSLLLGLICGTLVAATLHVMRGQNIRDLVALWLFVQMGFWSAHFAANLLRAPLWSVGDLHLLAALVGGTLAGGFAIVRRK